MHVYIGSSSTEAVICLTIFDFATEQQELVPDNVF